MEQCKIDRLNELSRLCRQAGAPRTGAGGAHTAPLGEYVDSVKASLQTHLDRTYVVDEAGQQRKLKKKE